MVGKLIHRQKSPAKRMDFTGKESMNENIKLIIEDILEAGGLAESMDENSQSSYSDRRGGGGSDHDSVSSKVSTMSISTFKNSLRLQKPNRIGLVAVLILVVGAGACATIVGLGLAAANQDHTNEFNRLAGEVVYQVDMALAAYTRTGLWVHQAQSVQPEMKMMSHRHFRNLYEYASKDIPFSAIGIARRVESEENRRLLENQTQEYLNEFYPEDHYQGFWQLENVNGTFLNTPRPVSPPYYPLHMIEPMENPYLREMLDFDVHTAPPLRNAIEQATTAGRPSMTPRLKPIGSSNRGQEEDKGYSVVIYHPGIDVSTAPATYSPSNDLSFIKFYISDLISQINVGHMGKTACVYIYDSADKEQQPAFLGAAVLHKPDGNEKEDEDDEAARFSVVPPIEIDQVRTDFPDLSYEKTISCSMRQWTIVVAAETGEFSSSTVSFIYLGGSMIFVACLCLALWMYTNAKRIHKINEVRSSAEREKAGLMIENARRAAKQERELNDFLSHEVRNPLSAAISACSFVSAAVNESEPLKDAASRQSTREDVTIIDTSLNFINDLLRNMLDMHRASRKQISVEFTPVDLLRDVLEPVANMLYQRGANYEVLLDCPEDLIVMSDRLRLKQTILNLARNAAKFVERGFIRLRAEVGPECGQVYLYIEDSGPGIPIDKQRTLFQKFQESLDSLNQGTGMGLCLCKKLVELLGGSIWLDEDYDSRVEGCPGARFAIALNTRPVTEDSITKFTSSRHSKTDDSTEDIESFGTNSSLLQDMPVTEEETAPTITLPDAMTCLFVDDDVLLRKLFSRSLKRAMPNWEVREASNGETALRLVDDHTFDIIFVDQYMSSAEKQLLGTETVHALRSKEVTSIVCGLSANDLEEAFLKAGADAFLIKPFPCKTDELQKTLTKILQTRTDAMAKR